MCGMANYELNPIQAVQTFWSLLNILSSMRVYAINRVTLG